ncbi:MAG: peptidoglycan-binding protein [Myxococcaceae bacterium]|nr:peptidoglycan-binding protein [Myxococcaceae bacterium]
MAPLTLGSHGSNVRALERRLNDLGYLKGKADGSFDQKTADAIIAYKSDHGWEDPRGIAGKRLAGSLGFGDSFDSGATPTGTGTGDGAKGKQKPLKGGTFNALVGRNPKFVANEVRKMAKARDLDFIQLQEISTYREQIKDIPGYKLITFPGSKDHGETGILVKDGITVSDRESIQAKGPGWKSKEGDPRAPRAATSVLLNGWLRVVSVHAPPAIDFRNGHAVGPEARVKSYKSLMTELAKAAKEYRKDGEAMVFGGDWNEGPNSTGVGSPHWLARVAGMKTYDGGRIDWEMARGATIERMRRRGDGGGSDHNLWTFVVKPK